MQYSFNKIRSGIISALFELYKRDKHILSINTNERSITHRFAIYIEKEFPEWDVDCEYNRDGEDPKEAHLNRSDETVNKNKCSRVFPDIIVHKRGREGKNLLVIEAKKDDPPVSETDREKDKRKIRAYYEDFEYNTGLFIIFNVKKSPLSADLEWYDDKKWKKERIDLEFNVSKEGY